MSTGGGPLFHLAGSRDAEVRGALAASSVQQNFAAMLLVVSIPARSCSNCSRKSDMKPTAQALLAGAGIRVGVRLTARRATARGEGGQPVVVARSGAVHGGAPLLHRRAAARAAYLVGRVEASAWAVVSEQAGGWYSPQASGFPANRSAMAFRFQGSPRLERFIRPPPVRCGRGRWAVLEQQATSPRPAACCRHPLGDVDLPGDAVGIGKGSRGPRIRIPPPGGAGLCSGRKPWHAGQ